MSVARIINQPGRAAQAVIFLGALAVAVTLTLMFQSVTGALAWLVTLPLALLVYGRGLRMIGYRSEAELTQLRMETSEVGRIWPKEYKDVKAYEHDAQLMSGRGWEALQQSQASTHLNIGRTLAVGSVFGPVGLMLGGGSWSKGKIVVTWIPTREIADRSPDPQSAATLHPQTPAKRWDRSRREGRHQRLERVRRH